MTSKTGFSRTITDDEYLRLSEQPSSSLFEFEKIKEPKPKKETPPEQAESTAPPEQSISDQNAEPGI